MTLHTNEKEVSRSPRRCEITIVKDGVKEKKMILVKDLPTNTKTGVWYTGGNAGNLLTVRKGKEYKSNIWGTFLQWRDKKRTIIKGEKGCKIIRHSITKKLDELDDDGNKKEIPVMKFYTVFNEEQTEEIKEEVKGNDREKEERKKG